jgi:hypothetical protein
MAWFLCWFKVFAILRPPPPSHLNLMHVRAGARIGVWGRVFDRALNYFPLPNPSILTFIEIQIIEPKSWDVSKETGGESRERRSPGEKATPQMTPLEIPLQPKQKRGPMGPHRRSLLAKHRLNLKVTREISDRVRRKMGHKINHKVNREMRRKAT